MLFAVWVVTWLCLTHLSDDWESLSTRERRWDGEGRLEKMEKKGGDRPQMIGSMSSTLDDPFISRCDGSVRCMCGPLYVRFLLQQLEREEG